LVGTPYYREVLHKAWKMLIRNHAHDEICGCSIDNVHRDNMNYYEEIKNKADELTAKALNSIARRIEIKRVKALVIFNSLAWERDSIATAVIKKPDKGFSIIDSDGNPVPCQVSSMERDGKVELSIWCKCVPPCGFKTYYITNREIELGGKEVKAGKNWMENNWVKVEINKNGSLNLIDKVSHKVYKKVGYFEDSGEIGDTYDYSYPKFDQIITTLDSKANITCIDSGPVYTRFKIEHRLKLPCSITGDRQTRSESQTEYPIITWVRLSANSPRVDYKTIINNVVKDHRLRIVFPTDIETDYSYADQQLDVAKFETQPKPYPKGVPEGMVIAGKDLIQVRSRPQKGWIDLTDGKRGLTLIAAGLPEYEVYRDRNSIALTLLRCVGWLARTDLLTREGDVGWEFFTPDAQCLGKYEYNYSVLPHQANWLKGEICNWAEDRACPLRVIEVDKKQKGALPASKSFLSLSPKILNVIVFKLAENNDDLVITIINRSGNEIQSTELELGFKVKKCYQVNLAEEIERELVLKNNKIKLNFKGKELINLRLEVEPEEIRIEGKETQLLASFLPPMMPDWFEQAKKPELVTEKDVENELQKLKAIESEFVKAKKEFEQTKFKNELERELARHRTIKLTRLVAEKKYSYLLTRKRYAELMSRRKEIRKLAQEIESLASEL
jgi:mannosylglycerate hydrolase